MPKPVAKRLVIERIETCNDCPHHEVYGDGLDFGVWCRRLDVDIPSDRRGHALHIPYDCPLPDAEPNERTDDDAD